MGGGRDGGGSDGSVVEMLVGGSGSDGCGSDGVLVVVVMESFDGFYPLNSFSSHSVAVVVVVVVVVEVVSFMVAVGLVEEMIVVMAVVVLVVILSTKETGDSIFHRFRVFFPERAAIEFVMLFFGGFKLRRWGTTFKHFPSIK